ncbi:MAG: START domain-containing protein [Bacteroidota bacterium]
MGKHLLLFLSVILLVSACPAQDDWKLKSEKDNIRVYSRKLSDSKINAVKLETVFNTSLARLVWVIMDVSAYDSWIYNSKSTRLLKKVSDTELYYYSEVVFPWPTSNRDFVSHVVVNQDPKTKTVTINANNVSGWEPVHKKLVRIDHSVGKWVLTPVSTNEVRVEYTLQVDPGGELPALLINSFSSTGMVRTFKTLREQLQKVSPPAAAVSFIME